MTFLRVLLKPLNDLLNLLIYLPMNSKIKINCNNFWLSQLCSRFFLNFKRCTNHYFKNSRKFILHGLISIFQIVMHIKCKVNSLLYLGIPNPYAFMIVNASNNSLDIILKQHLGPSPKHLKFYSHTWTRPQIHYSTIRKEILPIVLCISKFQNDFNKLLAIAKVPKKFQNLVSTNFCSLGSNIFIHKENNSFPNFPSREFLQAK